MKFLVSGSLAYDKIMDFKGKFGDHILPDAVHKLSVSFYIDKLNTNFGGTAGNIAYNLALLGEQAFVLSAAGSDFAEYEKWLQRHQINTDYIKKIDNEVTAAAYIVTDMSDNQIAAFYPGALNITNNEDFHEEFDWAIIAPTNIREMKNHALLCAQKSIPYIFDPGQQIPALSKEDLEACLSGAKILIVNDYEQAMILKKAGLSEKELAGKVEVLVTTHGAEGSLIKTEGKEIKVPSVKVEKVIDPTGAGDAYRAGFMKGIALQLPLEVCGRLASVAAAYAIENYGTQNHTFDLDEISQRYYDNYGEKLSL